MSRIELRLNRLEAALIPAAPNILTVQAIESATGEIIKEFQVVMNEPDYGRRGNRHRANTRPNQGALPRERRDEPA